MPGAAHPSALRTPARAWRFVVAALLVSAAVAMPAPAHAAGSADLISRGDGSGQATEVGTAFATQMSVAVFDSASALLPGVEVVFSAPGTGASGTFAGGGTSATVTTNGTGLATAPVFTANSTEGSYQVTASVDGSQTTDGEPLRSWFSLSNTSGPATAAHSISVGNGSGQATQVSTAFTTQMSVAVFDGSNRHLSDIEVVFSAPGTGASGTFAGGGTSATVTTNATGLATAPVFTANSTDGGYHVTASVDGSQTTDGNPLQASFALTNTLTNPNGVPQSISLAGGSGQSALIGDPFAAPIQVAVFDGANNHVVGADVAFEAPGSGASGTFAGGGTVLETSTDSTGMAVIPAFTANLVGGSYSIAVTATKGGESASASIPLTNTRVTTATELDVSPAGPTMVGESVTLTASVTPTPARVTPAGPVDFHADGTVLADCAAVLPNGGVATCATDDLPPGDIEVSAHYGGDDGSKPSGSATVDHTVVPDTSAPTLVVPGPITAEATSAAGVVVTYAVSASDDVTAVLDVNCAPASGTEFPLGDTTVTCSATDDAANTGTETFVVSVVDTTAPVVMAPSDQTVAAAGADGAVVDFTADATDTVDGDLTPTCDPASGSTFAPGVTTTVECTATDSAGNSTTATFTVTVGEFSAPPDEPSDADVSVTLSADTVQPGDEIAVVARGFRPGELIQVTLNSDPMDLGRYAANDAGVARFTVRVPSAAPTGDHVLRLVGRESGLAAAADLRITSPDTVATTAPGPAPTSTNAAVTLPDTGMAASTRLLAGVGGLLLLGGCFLTIRSRRHARGAIRNGVVSTHLVG